MQRKVSAIAIQYQFHLNRTLVLLACVCAVSVFLYGVFLLEAVAHAAASTAAERQMSQLSSTLGALETQYLSLTQALTPTRASELGFVTPAHVTTVFANAESPSLSLRDSSAQSLGAGR